VNPILVASAGEQARKDLAAETSGAVTKLLGCGVKHRDVWPPNVLWNPEIRNMVLVDFERSRILKEVPVLQETHLHFDPDASCRNLSDELPPPEDASEATPTELCSPTPALAFPANQPSAQVVTTYVQQFLDILKSLSTQQGPPSPPTKPSGESGEPKARASRLEFKTVNEVYVSKQEVVSGEDPGAAWDT
jgi:hypothetical protein